MTLVFNMSIKCVLLFSLMSLVFGTRLLSLESIDHEHRFLRHRDGKVFVIKIKSNLEKEATDGKEGRQASTFKIQPGLAAPNTKNAISFEPFNLPGYYLCQDKDNRVVVKKYEDNSKSFAMSATFLKKSGNAFSHFPNFVSFQSFLDKNAFIMERNFELWVGSGAGPEFNNATTFKKVAPNWTV